MKNGDLGCGNSTPAAVVFAVDSAVHVRTLQLLEASYYNLQYAVRTFRANPSYENLDAVTVAFQRRKRIIGDNEMKRTLAEELSEMYSEPLAGSNRY